MLFVSIIIVIVSGIIYHFCQKSIFPETHPLISLIITYTTAIILSMAAFSVWPLKSGIMDSIKQAGWPTYLLGLGIFGLEAGYLLAYRSGADLSSTAIYTSAAISIVLIPFGILLFKEQISLTRFLGIIMCLAGFMLINKK